MTKEIKLEAQLRDEKNGNVNNIRSGGFLPANVYGSGMENKNIKIKALNFNKVFAVAGESHLIDLEISGSDPLKVLVKDVQEDPVRGNVIHVDFYQVDMNKKITAEISLDFIGESKAVKELGGTLIKSLDSVEVKCLPGDLADKIKVDLSSLNNFHDSIKAGDLKLPAGMELAGQADETIITVLEPVKEEEKEEAPVEAGEEPKEGDEAGKKENKEEGEKAGEAEQKKK